MLFVRINHQKLNNLFFFSFSNHLLANMTPTGLIIKQYDNMYEQSMAALRNATDRVIEKEARLEALRKETETLRTFLNE